MISRKDIELRYSDTDQMGVIYHANYLSFFMQARTQFYKDAGYIYDETEKSGVIFPVREAKITYVSAVRLDEKIHILTKIHKLTKVKVEYYHEMYNEKNELKSKAYTTVVCVDRETFKTVRMNERLPEVYKDYMKLKEED